MPEPVGHNERSDQDVLCGQCHAIQVTEGQIPMYCSKCSPPRIPECPQCRELMRRSEEATA